MDPITPFLKIIDPFLIAPFRLFDDPLLGWWAGMLVLAFWAVLLGEITVAVVFRVNRTHIAEQWKETSYYHEQSLKAKQSGDESAYEGINKLANEAYGKSFFLFLAMGMASIWPAFFAAAWLNLRFGEVALFLPRWLGGAELSFLAPFVLLYLAVRVLFSRAKRFIPFLSPPSVEPSSGDRQEGNR
ncbi:MAG TPA: hypothetical protein ENF48_08855 [Desulfobacteraceae bacterium]|nr:hypothetical protein [Deltaproteobacteria bacterium]MBW2355633.1 hypothetical protein [Deltaproteobacteria bacterium]RLB98804.1 MAG: hypothetical protein DRH76_01630 [Deltaproteobacteria bacterium]HDI60436.1 hypothetical protein [Desulfobacteraceae bacterium]HDI60443.1 hypothetical protein [Desulfobacteraceae bacterium]